MSTNSNNIPHERYAENAPGAFYVEKDRCITCLLPHHEAPDLMGLIDGSNDKTSHCFFKKQPETDSEIQQAINAIAVACCDALRYGGRDISVLRALAIKGLSEQCDNSSD